MPDGQRTSVGSALTVTTSAARLPAGARHLGAHSVSYACLLKVLVLCAEYAIDRFRNMTAIASHPAGSSDLASLTFRYTRNPDGWVTAQIAEFPEAISQGASEHEAYVNVLEALHDLTHEPTLTERIAFTAQARVVEPLEGLIEPLGGMISSLLAAARDRARDRVH